MDLARDWRISAVADETLAWFACKDSSALVLYILNRAAKLVSISLGFKFNITIISERRVEDAVSLGSQT